MAGILSSFVHDYDSMYDLLDDARMQIASIIVQCRVHNYFQNGNSDWTVSISFATAPCL